jgi:hypothetical protein
MSALVSEDVARAILREFYSVSGPTTADMARKYGLHPSTISRLISGETHRHVPRPGKPRAIAPRPPRVRLRPLTRSQEIASVMVALDYPAEEIAARLGLNATNTAKLLANPTVVEHAEALRSPDSQIVQLALLCIAISGDECRDLLFKSDHPVAVRARQAGKTSIDWLNSVPDQLIADAIAPNPPAAPTMSAAMRLLLKPFPTAAKE